MPRLQVSCVDQGWVEYTITSSSYGSGAAACAAFGVDPTTTVYSQSNVVNEVVIFFLDFGSTPFTGDGGKYAWVITSIPGTVANGNVDSIGNATNQALC